MEKKVFKFDIKAVEDSGKFEGYASVFGNVDLGWDVIEKGAFTKTLAEKGKFPLFFLHNAHKIPVGVVEGAQDEYGLKVSGELFLSDFEGKPLQDPRLLHASMKRGAVNGLSIGYDAVQREYIKDDAGKDIRKIKEVKLYEVSVVPWPMNEAARVTAVKGADAEIEEALRRIEAIAAEIKDGREISAESKKRIQSALKALEALPPSTEPPAGTPPDDGKPPDKANGPVDRDHLLTKTIEDLKALRSKINGG